MHLPTTSLLLGASLAALLAGGEAAASPVLAQSAASAAPLTRPDAPGTGAARSSGGAPLPQTGLGGAPQWLLSAHGADFVQASATTRTAGIALTQTCPFNLPLPALPAGATVVESFAVWNYLSDSAPAGDTINLNGNAVMGIQAGAGQGDLCWGKAGAVSYVATGVHPFLNLGGNNVVGGMCDKALGADPTALGEGVTILVVYEQPHGPKRTVSVWWGYTSTESSATGDANALFVLPLPYAGGPTHLFMNALDGQTAAGDNFLFNGVGASGLLSGTWMPGEAWVGLAGPLVNDNLYDAVDDDVSALIPVGDMTLQTRSVKITDCIGHSFAAFTQDEACGNVVTYCGAKVNSQGCTPTISASGTPSVTVGSGPFDVKVGSLINNKPGVLIYGFGQAAIPFQGGTLCIQPPVTRSGIKNTGGNPPPDDCSGVFLADFNAVIQAGVDPALTVGATVFVQVWSRDVADPFGSSLSDALCFDICQ